MVALMERGDVFGEMGLFDGLGRSAEARALEPSELVILPYAPLKAVYESRPTLLWGVVRLLAGRLRNTDAALADSVFLDVTGRTAKRLLQLAGEADEFAPPLPRGRLAGSGCLAATHKRLFVGDRDAANRADVFICLDDATGE